MSLPASHRAPPFLKSGLLAAVAAAALTGNALAQAPDFPDFDVILKPTATDGATDRLAVRLEIEAPGFKAGDTVLKMPVILVSTPTAAYETADLSVTDDLGPLVLTQVEEEPTPTGTYRHWTLDRATEGDLTVTYATPPRAVDSTTRNGPLFDLRAEQGGIQGAGVYFMALPELEGPSEITLDWDLSALPEGARGIWSFGEGTVEKITSPEQLRFTYYAAGPVQSVPENGEGDFVVYWLSDAPFDMKKTAGELGDLFHYMADFFEDEGDPYRVFVRQNPYPGGGGTALPQSFMFAYGSDGQTKGEDGTTLLVAHEIAHKWPTLNGEEDHALTSWYTEGNAEFYSLNLAYRAGIINFDKFLNAANTKAEDYYTNPYRAYSNADAGEHYWSDAKAQRVPYGRGYMYLTRVDAQLRAASTGQKSLDDLVLEVLTRQRAGEKIGNEQWVEILVRELGPSARDEFEAMVAGETIVPPAGSLSPCVSVEKTTIREFDLGFDRMRLAVVADLDPDSAAAKAGAEEGDTIVEIQGRDDAFRDPSTEMTLVVDRDGQREEITYLPRGPEVEGWKWVQKPGEKCTNQ